LAFANTPASRSKTNNHGSDNSEKNIVVQVPAPVGVEAVCRICHGILRTSRGPKAQFVLKFHGVKGKLSVAMGFNAGTWVQACLVQFRNSDKTNESNAVHHSHTRVSIPVSDFAADYFLTVVRLCTSEYG
jgi:hypothetical protein